MIEDFDVIEEIDELDQPKPTGKKACMTIVTILVALTLVLTAAVPLAQFLIRRDFERQVNSFPVAVCENLAKASIFNQDCDSTLPVGEFVAKTFPGGVSMRFVEAAMAGYQVETLTGISQLDCQDPAMLTYSVAKSVLNWKTEVEFLFCSGLLIEKVVLLNGAPLRLPAYDF
jgi:hypothetical protein